MVKKIAAFMQAHQMVHTGDHISVGLSGGADSVCLFLVLEELRHTMGFTMSAVHVEHGIRGKESIEDMEFACRLCGRYRIPFACRTYPVAELAKEQGLSIEEAGRNIRYEAFEAERQRYEKEAAARGGAAKTAVAHHGDDNAETMLFHLCRGSGIEGLAGIWPVRGAMIRPMLCVTRKEIECFLKERGQEYRTDATNTDLCYSRNRIRSRVMPELALLNEASVAHMNCLSEDIREISAYLQQEVDQVLKKYMEKTEDKTIRFCTEGLCKMPPFLQKRVMLGLMEAAAGSRKDFTREHAAALLAIAGGQTGRKMSLPYGILAQNSYGTLLLSPQGKERKETEASAFPVEGMEGKISFLHGVFWYRVLAVSKKDVKIPKNLYTKWFDYDKIKNRLYLRTRRPGDYFVLDAQGRRQKLKDYWINEKVPRFQRDQIPLLAEGSHILWAAGYRISAYYKITEDTKRVLEVQFMEEEE